MCVCVSLYIYKYGANNIYTESFFSPEETLSFLTDNYGLFGPASNDFIEDAYRKKEIYGLLAVSLLFFFYLSIFNI